MIRTFLTLCPLLLAGALVAQGEGHPASQVGEVEFEAARMLDKNGAVVDRELSFVDERGYPFQLKQLVPGQRPVVLMLGYYHCPAMCGQVMGAAFAALSEVSLEPGKDYELLSVSIDPKETPEVAKARKDAFLPKLAKVGAEAGWHVLTGQEPAIRALADAVGFQYFFAQGQYAHPPALVFLTPDGHVSRAIVNTVFEPDDLRLALVEASKGTLGSMWDQVRLNCLTFDPRTNTYSLTAMTIMRVGGAITLAALVTMIVVLTRSSRRNAPPVAIAAALASPSRPLIQD